jgi:hypothetical protein
VTPCAAVLAGGEDPPSELMEGELRRGVGVSRPVVLEDLVTVITSSKILSVLPHTVAQSAVGNYGSLQYGRALYQDGSPNEPLCVAIAEPGGLAGPVATAIVSDVL